ncbi:hypothetical protein [Thiocapsa marina]|uniref:Uncharacterized protein n=1 Tax=Thiocapsa marina 5811 TaxID=768671 RepID=F9U7D1_9GAMM|nr:hypothetical protein [Thiocapsa marina]EGV20157.1 hypothetical protein ThimaDRAFT_0833 [Thiocapsa marina 5811]
MTSSCSIPGELFAEFQTSFYADPVEAVFKALRMGYRVGVRDTVRHNRRQSDAYAVRQIHAATGQRLDNQALVGIAGLLLCTKQRLPPLSVQTYPACACPSGYGLA